MKLVNEDALKYEIVQRTFSVNKEDPAELLAFLVTIISAAESAETTSLQIAAQLHIKHAESIRPGVNVAL